MPSLSCCRSTGSVRRSVLGDDRTLALAERGPVEAVVQTDAPDVLVHLDVGVGATGGAAVHDAGFVAVLQGAEVGIEQFALDRPAAEQRVFGADANHPAGLVDAGGLTLRAG